MNAKMDERTLPKGDFFSLLNDHSNFPNELGSIGMGLDLEGSLLRPTT